MFKRNFISFVSLCLSLVFSAAPYAAINISPTDTTAEIVHIRKNCTGVTNCATTFQELLDWTWNTRMPTSSRPLLIDVGPGDFDSFYCINTGTTYNTGFVTVRGSGPENSVIRNTSRQSAVVIRNCTKLTFKDISIVASEDKFAPAGIKWHGGGTSVWSNVFVNTTSQSGTTYGWYDLGANAIDCEGVHYWFGSKISVAARFNSYGYKSNCGETWFYGGDIEIYVDNDTNTNARIIAVDAQDDIRIFGSTVRTHILSDTTVLNINPNEFTGVNVSGQLHMHGGIIAVDASRATQSVDVNGINGGNNGVAHTPMTAFRISAGGAGTAYRIKGGSDISSPFTWPKSDTPPTIVTTTGSDTFIETDCDTNGDCSGQGIDQHPHMMIYDSSCVTNGPWFDIATNACRQ